MLQSIGSMLPRALTLGGHPKAANEGQLKTGQ
jgi:hypothetical protein